MDLTLNLLFGILIPLFGTALGSAAVFFMNAKQGNSLRGILCGVAAGVMLAASVWSMLIPSFDLSGSAAVIPASGFLCGMGFFLLFDGVTENLFTSKSSLFVMESAIWLHNVPEGMAVGVLWAKVLAEAGEGVESAFLMSLGIAVQNLPEGAVISLPRALSGSSRKKAFWLGTLSGALEPVAAILTLFLCRFISALLPFLLAFAAGAMIYVVCDELIPALKEESDPKGVKGLVGFALGFVLMMMLDVLFS